MSLIKPKAKIKRQVVRLNLDDNVVQSMHAYCSWAGIDRLEDFVEETARLLMKKDKAWVRSQNKSQP